MEGAADGGQGDLLSRLSAVDRRPLRDPATAAELRRFAEQGRGRVMVVLLARAVARMLPSPITAFTATVGILVTGGWPYLLALVLGGLLEDDPLRGTTGALLVLSATVTSVLMLALSWIAWRWTAVLAESVADLLAVSAERGEFLGWLNGRCRPVPQLMAGVAGMCLSALLAYAMSHQQVDSVSVSVWIYVCCAWTGFIGGGVLYWLHTLAEVPLRLHRCMDLQMAWMDPAHTPAIVQLCRVYGRVAVSTVVGVLIAELSTVAAPSRPTRISGRCAASRSRPPPFCST